MRVLIAGVGDVGRELANNLTRKKDNELVLIDVKEDICDDLASDFDALVVHGDATDPDILEKAQIEEADALLATTGEDPINTVIAMLASRMGVEKIIVTLNSVGLRSACHEIGVDKIITPKISAAAEIVSSLYNLDRVNFSVLASGGLQLVEIQVSDDSKKKISELEIPDSSHIVSVLRGERMMLPRGDLELENKDGILFLTEEEDKLDSVREQFEKEND